MSKRALITGIAGQDGSYLAELLLAKGYDVYGMVRRSGYPNHSNIAGILSDITLLDGDMIDQSSLIAVLQKSQPDEIYNLAAQSHVGVSFTQPHVTAQATGIGVLRLLEAMRLVGAGGMRLYQASTSELYGNSLTSPQNEETPFAPRSPYATAKLYAHHMVKNYREAYGLFACCGILYNHESPRRGLDFVTRKITHSIARIKAGLQDHLELGNMHAQRDWGYAPDYVEAMWLMLQQPHPKEYVIATGCMHSVSEFLVRALLAADLPFDDDLLQITEEHERPADVAKLCGDASLARNELGWFPRTSFDELVTMMVESDLYATTYTEPKTRLVAD